MEQTEISVMLKHITRLSNKKDMVLMIKALQETMFVKHIATDKDVSSVFKKLLQR